MKRPIVGVVDQGFSSITNFATTLLAARIADPDRFGTLALALSVTFMVMILARGLTAEPIMTSCPRLDGAPLRAAERDAIALAAALGLLVGVGVAASSLIPVHATQDFAWVAACIPFILVQDALRYVGFARRRPQDALVMDVVWAVVQLGVTLALLAAGTLTLQGVIAGWGCGAAVSCVAGAAVLGLRRFGSPRRWLRTTRSYSAWVLPQLVVSQATDQGGSLLVAAVFGTATFGGFRAVQMFVRPAFVFMMAMQAVLVPSLTRRLVRSGAAEVMRVSTRLGAVIGGIALAGGIVVAAFATPFTRLVFGPAYAGYAGLLLPFAASSVFHSCSVVPSSALRAFQCGRRILLVQAAASVVAITCVGLAAATSTWYVAAWAGSTQGVIASIVGWIVLAKTVRERAGQGPEPVVDAPLQPVGVPAFAAKACALEPEGSA
jgi:O-antigen/teichoic acid export membrane protein